MTANSKLPFNWYDGVVAFFSILIFIIMLGCSGCSKKINSSILTDSSTISQLDKLQLKNGETFTLSHDNAINLKITRIGDSYRVEHPGVNKLPGYKIKIKNIKINSDNVIKDKSKVKSKVKDQDKVKISQGIPWWVFLIGAFVIIGCVYWVIK